MVQSDIKAKNVFEAFPEPTIQDDQIWKKQHLAIRHPFIKLFPPKGRHHKKECPCGATHGERWKSKTTLANHHRDTQLHKIAKNNNFKSHGGILEDLQTYFICCSVNLKMFGQSTATWIAMRLKESTTTCLWSTNDSAVITLVTLLITHELRFSAAVALHFSLASVLHRCWMLVLVLLYCTAATALTHLVLHSGDWHHFTSDMFKHAPSLWRGSGDWRGSAVEAR